MTDTNETNSMPEPRTDHVRTLAVGGHCMQAGDFELMSQFARMHNLQCPKALTDSEEDGKPYCRYNLHTSEGGCGQNFYLRCQECGEARYCGAAWNV